MASHSSIEILPQFLHVVRLGLGWLKFWKALVKLKGIFHHCVRFSVNDGKSVRFWLGLWSPVGRLAKVFPTLFAHCLNSNISISEVATADRDLGFHRALSPES